MSTSPTKELELIAKGKRPANPKKKLGARS
jgi:hypothetical protein